MEVRIFCGANAYACITESGRKTDILLAPGKSAQASLREYAQEQRERAARIIAMADIAERAAAKLDPAPDDGRTRGNDRAMRHYMIHAPRHEHFSNNAGEA